MAVTTLLAVFAVGLHVDLSIDYTESFRIIALKGIYYSDSYDGFLTGQCRANIPPSQLRGTKIVQHPKKLLDQMRDALRLKHYSIRTENSYVAWTKRYILFHNQQHPLDLGSTEIEAFLTHLAVKEKVAASTQNQALSALLFLYREVLKKDLAFPIDSIRAKKPRRLPTCHSERLSPGKDTLSLRSDR